MSHFKRYSLTLLASAGAALVLSACGAGDPVPSNVETWGEGLTQSVVFADGLECTVYDTLYGGGVSCNWPTLGAASVSDVKSEILETEAGTLEVRGIDGDRVCVALDGFRSGGIDCFYFGQ